MTSYLMSPYPCQVLIKEEEPDYEPICVSPPPLNKPDLRVACDFCTNSYCDNSYYYKHANKEHVEEISGKNRKR